MSKRIKLRDIDYQLIEEELDDGFSEEFEFLQYKPSNKKIDKLINNYYVHEFTEHYYDTEPEIKNGREEYFFETVAGRDEYQKLLNEYEPARIRKNNWIDVYAAHIWGMRQKDVDQLAISQIRNLKTRRTWEKSDLKYWIKDRFYLSNELERNGKIYRLLYWYGRDTDLEVDFWWIFVKRKNRKERIKRKRYVR